MNHQSLNRLYLLAALFGLHVFGTSAFAESQYLTNLRNLAHIASYGMDNRCECPIDKAQMPMYERCMVRVKSRIPATFDLPLRFLKIPQTQFRAFLEEQSYLVVEACRQGTLSKDVRSSDEAIIGAETDGTTPIKDYEVTIQMLASPGVISFESRYSSSSAYLAPILAVPSKFTISVGAATSLVRVEVPVTNTTTLSEFVSAINKASDRVRAFMVNLGNEAYPSYQISLIGLKNGVEEGSLSVTLAGDLLAEGTLAFHQTTQATDAIFSVAGIGQFVSPSNEITDAVPGLTLQLRNTGTAILRVR